MDKSLFAGEMHLPEPESLPGCPFHSLSFYLLEDEIFPLKAWLMRPYPENTFNILVTILRNSNAPINASVEIVEKYVNAAVVLHNYLRQTENAAYCPSGFVDF